MLSASDHFAVVPQYVALGRSHMGWPLGLWRFLLLTTDRVIFVSEGVNLALVSPGRKHAEQPGRMVSIAGKNSFQRYLGDTFQSVAATMRALLHL